MERGGWEVVLEVVEETWDGGRRGGGGGEDGEGGHGKSLSWRRT